MPRNTLNPSEWFVIASFFTLLFSFVAAAKISSWKAQSLLSKEVFLKEVQVEVSGEVMRPGLYEVPEGTLVGEVLKKARPKRFADLSQIDMQAAAPQVLFIPALEALRVTVSGDGVEEPVTLFLKPGTRFFELKTRAPLLPDADLAPFRSRKMVRDGEEIRVEKEKKSKSHCT